MKHGWSIVLMTAWYACGGDARQTTPSAPPDRDALIEENQRAMRVEKLDIDRYVSRHDLQTLTTGTGLRYRLLRDLEGSTAKPDYIATVNYCVTLLNGDTAYRSAASGPESFRVEHDDVESGLHEGIQLMSPGDSALLIIPSHRAFGLFGDRDKIPPRSTVIYRIGLVKVSAPAR